MLMQQDSGILLNGQREYEVFGKILFLFFSRLVLRAITNLLGFSDSDADILR